MSRQYLLEPRVVPKVETALRRIVTAIPAPESIPVLEKLRRFEPVAMEGQPPIIYIDNNTFAFNADYASNTPPDSNGIYYSIYYTPRAPTSEVSAISVSNQITIPNTAVVYPQADYLLAPGIMGPAEMIVFWFAPDTETARTDDYVLFRQVNNSPPEAVVRNILADTVPFFQFMYLKDSGSTLSIDTVPQAELPLDAQLA